MRISSYHTAPAALIPCDVDTGEQRPNARLELDAASWLDQLDTDDLNDLIVNGFVGEVADGLIGHARDETYRHYPDQVEDIARFFTAAQTLDFGVFVQFNEPTVTRHLADTCWNHLGLDARVHLVNDHQVEVRAPYLHVIVNGDGDTDNAGFPLCWANSDGWVPYDFADRYTDRDTDLPLGAAGWAANTPEDAARVAGVDPAGPEPTNVHPDLSMNARAFAIAAIKVFAHVSKAVAARAVDTGRYDLLGDVDEDAAACIVMDCHQQTVNALSVHALLSAMGVESSLSRTETHAEVHFISHGERVVADERDWSSAFQYTNLRQFLDTGVATDGHGNPLYVARKLRNMPGY